MTTAVWTTVVGADILDPMEASPALPSAAACPGKFDSLEQEVFLNLWRTYDRLKRFEEEVFSRFALSAQQYNTLRLLRSAHPGAVPTLALAARLVSRSPDMTRLLDKLEQRELLHRQRKRENRRVVQVSITPQGLDLLEQMDEPVRDCHRRQLGHMDTGAMHQLAALLRTAREPHEDPQNPSLVDP